jgi:hypothetical protein
MSYSDWEYRNHYEVLDVDPKASASQIKKAYRRLARKYHPDLNPQRPRTSEDRFKRLQHAYDILSDPISRQQYDEALSYSSSTATEDHLQYEDVSPNWYYEEESNWKYFFTELNWRRKAAIACWLLCVLGTFLPTSPPAIISAGRLLETSVAERIISISIPFGFIWVGTWLSEDETLDMSLGPVIKQTFGYVLEVIGWLILVRLIGYYLLGPLALLLT